MPNGVIRITIVNFVIVGLMAIAFERVAKLILSQYRVNGLSELIGA